VLFGVLRKSHTGVKKGRDEQNFASANPPQEELSLPVSLVNETLKGVTDGHWGKRTKVRIRGQQKVRLHGVNVGGSWIAKRFGGGNKREIQLLQILAVLMW